MAVHFEVPRVCLRSSQTANQSCNRWKYYWTYKKLIFKTHARGIYRIGSFSSIVFIMGLIAAKQTSFYCILRYGKVINVDSALDENAFNWITMETVDHLSVIRLFFNVYSHRKAMKKTLSEWEKISLIEWFGVHSLLNIFGESWKWIIHFIWKLIFNHVNWRNCS